MAKKNPFFYLSCILIIIICIAACQNESSQISLQPTTVKEITKTATVTPTIADSTVEPTEAEQPEQAANDEASTAIPIPTATPDLRLDPADWQEWPVIPTISARAIEIYLEGLKKGNIPTHFSKIGDCQNVPSYFLADFDKGRYTLGDDYAYLQEVIDYYVGSWRRESVAVKGGFNVASVLNPIFANQDLCESNESPLQCELRLQQPSVVIISMETWWNHDDPSKYEFYMRKILDEVIAHGALPILATKADNLEGDHLINQSIAQLAYEYDIPMWNFWAAADVLPEHGLNEDGFHLTIGLGNYFDDPDNTVAAWPIRNLTALQTMDAVFQAVKDVQ